MRLTRRRLLEAGAAGAAGAALLPTAGCDSDDEASAGNGRLNVLVLIIDSLRADHVGAYGAPLVQTPNIDALANRGVRFTRAFPEAMVTVPARRSIFGSRRIFPFRDWKPNKEIGTSPGWLPIDDPQKTFTTALKERGYWTAQVSDNPFLAFMKSFEPFRETFHEWKTVVGQSGFRQPPENVSLETVNHWLPPFLRDERYVPGMRKYLANTGEGRDEEGTCSTTPAAASRSRSRSTASTRTSRGALRRSTSTCTATRTTRAQRWASRPTASNRTSRRSCCGASTRPTRAR